MAIVAAAVFTAGCNKADNLYSGPEYVMFADTLAVYPVFEDQTFGVTVVSTVARQYDRTFGVEIIDKSSNAIENRHYRLKSHTVTIPAGRLSTEVEVEGLYHNIDDSDSLGFTMRLVMPDELESPFDDREAKVSLMKVKPLDTSSDEALRTSVREFIRADLNDEDASNDDTGYCVLSSMFLLEYTQNNKYQNLIRVRISDDDPTVLICDSWLYRGYPVKIYLDTEDPADPVVTVGYGQQINTELEAFGIIRGDNRLRIADSAVYPSFYNVLQHYATTSYRVFVSNLGTEYGTVGHYYNIMEFVTYEEAKRLEKEGVLHIPDPIE